MLRVHVVALQSSVQFTKLMEDTCTELVGKKANSGGQEHTKHPGSIQALVACLRENKRECQHRP